MRSWMERNGLKLNTIDIDNTELWNLERILHKVKKCDFLDCLSLEPSLNGWHVTLHCDRECDLCRFVFDDQLRYKWDLERNVASRDVFFDFKVPLTIFEIFSYLSGESADIIRKKVSRGNLSGGCDSRSCELNSGE